MAEERPDKLTPLESVVMDCVWELEEATVRDVKEKLGRDLAYNTVLTVMRGLREKDYLDSRREGRADVYWPEVSRELAARRPLRELLDRFFAGSATALVSELMDTAELDADEIEAIREEVDEKLRDGA